MLVRLHPAGAPLRHFFLGDSGKSHRQRVKKGGSVKAVRFSVLAAVIAAFLSIAGGRFGEPGPGCGSRRLRGRPSFNLAVPSTPATPRPASAAGRRHSTSFIGQLVDHKFAGAWHFAPKQVNLKTRFFASLRESRRRDALAHRGHAVRRRRHRAATEHDLVRHDDSAVLLLPTAEHRPGGGTITIPAAALTPGTHLFFCAIHPWMEETVRVS